MMTCARVRILAALLIVSAPVLGGEQAPIPQPSTLTILHLNDTHSNLLPAMVAVTFPPDSQLWRLPAGSVARLATVVDSIRGDRNDVVFLHAGDLVQGTLFYTMFGGEADAAVYDAMGLDAMCPGNHEFDRGSEGLAVLLDVAEFPVVCANLDVSGDSLLAGRIAPYVVLGDGAPRTGVVGLVVDELANVSSPSSGTVVLPLVESAQRAIDALEELGVDRIVVLTHVGYADDLALAASLRGADVIVGGHSHTVLGDLSCLGLPSEGEYPTVVEGLDGGDVLVVTAGTRATLLGVLTVGFDADGRVTSFEGSPILVTGGDFQDASRSPVAGDALAELETRIAACPVLRVAEEEPAVRELVGNFEAELAAFAYEVVGTAPADLPHRRIPGGDLPDGSAIAPLICEAMLWKAGEVGLEPDLAILNAGGARIPIPAGDVTVGTVYTLLPFGNTLAVLDATGAQVRCALEDALSNILDDGNSDGSFPYAAGLRYTADARLPEGGRVTVLEVRGGDGAWLPIDPDSTYRVVTPFFLARGGDGYATFAGLEAMDTGFVDAEVFMEYLADRGTLSAVEPGVTFLGSE